MIRFIIVIIIFYSVTAYSSAEYCVNKLPIHSEKLTYKEICKYGKYCLDVSRIEKTMMYCDEVNLSECFENKAWVGIHDYVGAAKNEIVKGTSKRYKKENGKITKTFCGTNENKS